MFPFSGLNPKVETGIQEFQAQNPQFDGRRTVVAIFDTGCDVTAAGLLKTSTGQVKFIDAIDTTGSGDVDCIPVRPDANHQLWGLSGRKLTINPAWKNPSGVFFLGCKRLFDITPSKVERGIKTERSQHRDALIQQYTEYLTQLESNQEEKTSEKEYQARVDFFSSTMSSSSADETGPLLDCLVWHDGEHYCAIIDTLELGNLAHPSLQVMRDYALFQEYSFFHFGTQMSYTIKIYPQDQAHIVLQIVVAQGTHGTHVAGIVGAYFGDEAQDKDKNGSAPGCQLISVKIGDSFLGTMETQPGVLRGFLESVYQRCDIINMSYGEATTVANQGQISEFINYVVTKYGVFFISSAGNEGPCLNTLGAPGGSAEHAISVAAAITTTMTDSQYSISQPSLCSKSTRDAKTHIQPFHWSSRGPNSHGALPSITGLGAAYTSVPRWNQQHFQQMNGTSMSSPNVTGVLAAFISSLKIRGKHYSIPRVRSVMERSARFIDNTVFATGNGLIDVNAMVTLYDSCETDPCFDNHYRIRVLDRGTNEVKRGVYLRGANVQLESHKYSLEITPEFPEYQWQLDQRKLQSRYTQDSVQSATCSKTGTKTQLKPETEIAPPSGCIVEELQRPTTSPLCHLRTVNVQQKYDFHQYIMFRLRDESGQIYPIPCISSASPSPSPSPSANSSSSTSPLDWISLSASTILTNSSKLIPLVVHADKLASKPGVHFAWIEGVIAENVESTNNVFPNSFEEVLFTLPVTVIIPEIDDLARLPTPPPTSLPAPPPHQFTHNNIHLEPLNCPRFFYQAPHASQWLSIEIKSDQAISHERILWLSSNIITPGAKDCRQFNIVQLTSQQSDKIILKTIPNAIQEITIMLPWTTDLERLDISFVVKFFGVNVSTNHGSLQGGITLSPSTPLLPINFSTISNLVKFQPHIELQSASMPIRHEKVTFWQIANNTHLLNHLQTKYLPCSTDSSSTTSPTATVTATSSANKPDAPIDLYKDLSPLGIYDRELLPHQDAIYGCLFEFPFTIAEKCKGTFSFVKTAQHLYESPFSGQFVHIYKKADDKDAKKTNYIQYEHFQANDAYPQRRMAEYTPGSYVAHVFIKHQSLALLRSLAGLAVDGKPLKTAPVLGSFFTKLTRPLKSSVFSNLDSAVTGGSKCSAPFFHPSSCPVSGFINYDAISNEISANAQAAQFTNFSGFLIPFASSELPTHFPSTHTKLNVFSTPVHVQWHGAAPVNLDAKITIEDHTKDKKFLQLSSKFVPFALIGTLPSVSKVTPYIIKNYKGGNGKKGSESDTTDPADSNKDKDGEKSPEKPADPTDPTVTPLPSVPPTPIPSAIDSFSDQTTGSPTTTTTTAKSLTLATTSPQASPTTQTNADAGVTSEENDGALNIFSIFNFPSSPDAFKFSQNADGSTCDHADYNNPQCTKAHLISLLSNELTAEFTFNSQLELLQKLTSKQDSSAINIFPRSKADSPNAAKQQNKDNARVITLLYRDIGTTLLQHVLDKIAAHIQPVGDASAAKKEKTTQQLFDDFAAVYRVLIRLLGQLKFNIGYYDENDTSKPAPGGENADTTGTQKTSIYDTQFTNAAVHGFVDSEVAMLRNIFNFQAIFSLFGQLPTIVSADKRVSTFSAESVQKALDSAQSQSQGSPTNKKKGDKKTTIDSSVIVSQLYTILTPYIEATFLHLSMYAYQTLFHDTSAQNDGARKDGTQKDGECNKTKCENDLQQLSAFYTLLQRYARDVMLTVPTPQTSMNDKSVQQNQQIAAQVQTVYQLYQICAEYRLTNISEPQSVVISTNGLKLPCFMTLFNALIALVSSPQNSQQNSNQTSSHHISAFFHHLYNYFKRTILACIADQTAKATGTGTGTGTGTQPTSANAAVQLEEEIKALPAYQPTSFTASITAQFGDLFMTTFDWTPITETISISQAGAAGVANAATGNAAQNLPQDVTTVCNPLLQRYSLNTQAKIITQQPKRFF